MSLGLGKHTGTVVHVTRVVALWQASGTRYPGTAANCAPTLSQWNTARSVYHQEDSGPSLVHISNPAVPSTLWLPEMVENVYQDGM
eukprot:2832746-Rhodomonas_salina.3